MTPPKVRLSIGAGFSPYADGSLDEQLDFLCELEDMNLLHLAGGGGGDTQSSIYGGLALVAQRTRRTLVGTMVTNPYAVLPTVAAGELSLVQHVSGGRAAFVLGTGGGQSRATLRQYGLEPARMAEFREYALAVKGLCAGGAVTYQGHALEIWGDRPPSNVPLYLDVSGPVSMRLAGEIADGAIIPYGIGKEPVQQLKDGIAEGAATAGRNPAAIDCWWIPPVMPARTKAEGLEKLKFYLAMRTNSIMSYPERKGVPYALHDAIRAYRDDYVPTEHGQPDSAVNAKLLDEHGLTEWAADRHAIYGPPERIVERIHEVAEWGVTNIMFALWERDLAERRATARMFAEKVVPFVS